MGKGRTWNASRKATKKTCGMRLYLSIFLPLGQSVSACPKAFLPLRPFPQNVNASEKCEGNFGCPFGKRFKCCEDNFYGFLQKFCFTHCNRNGIRSSLWGFCIPDIQGHLELEERNGDETFGTCNFNFQLPPGPQLARRCIGRVK